MKEPFRKSTFYDFACYLSFCPTSVQFQWNGNKKTTVTLDSTGEVQYTLWLLHSSSEVTLCPHGNSEYASDTQWPVDSNPILLKETPTHRCPTALPHLPCVVGDLLVTVVTATTGTQHRSTTPAGIATAFHRPHQLETRGMSASAYFEIKKNKNKKNTVYFFPKKLSLYPHGLEMVPSFPTPQEALVQSCPSVWGTSLREKTVAMRERKGWSLWGSLAARPCTKGHGTRKTSL